MKTRTIADVKEALQQFPSITPWEKVEVNQTYHIAPIITLARRDVLIVKKEGDTATYHRLDTKEDKDLTFHKTSVLARFLVKKKAY